MRRDRDSRNARSGLSRIDAVTLRSETPQKPDHHRVYLVSNSAGAGDLTRTTQAVVPGRPIRKLEPRVRAGLDVARAAAAIYVVLHHAVSLPEPFGVLLSFGQEAVLVFFLLSGFVIFANERARVNRPKGYYLRRLRRIYPPMLVAMVVSTLLWSMGLITADFSWESLLGTLLAMQDIAFLKPGVITEPYLGNDPLWSLSYEIAFYLLFPLVMVGWRRSVMATRWLVPAVSIVALGSYLVVPNHFSLVLAYLMMWWAGAMAAHLYLSDSLRFRNALPELVGLVLLGLVAAGGVVLHGYHGLGFFPFLIFRHYAVVLILVILVLTPVRRWLAAGSAMIAGPAVAVASISYGLYLVHYPILVQTGANQSWWFVPAVAAAVGCAWAADRWIPSLLPRAPRT